MSPVQPFGFFFLLYFVRALVFCGNGDVYCVLLLVFGRAFVGHFYLVMSRALLTLRPDVSLEVVIQAT